MSTVTAEISQRFGWCLDGHHATCPRVIETVHTRIHPDRVVAGTRQILCGCTDLKCPCSRLPGKR